MDRLHQRIAALTDRWRVDAYPCDEFPFIAELLEWARDTETGNLRFLRRPQLRALETYWYLRLVERTPHTFALYRKLYPKQSELLAALGLDHSDTKAERERAHPLDGEMGKKAIALKKWEDLNPDRLKHHMIFTNTDAITFDQMQATRAFLEGAGT